MAITPLAGLAPDWFTPESQKEDEKPTRFKIEPMDGLQYLELMNMGTVDEKGQFKPSTAGRKFMLSNCLKGWENFGELEFNLENCRRIPPEILHELLNEIVIRSELDEGQEKN